MTLATRLVSTSVHAKIHVTHLVDLAEESGVGVDDLHLMSVVLCQFEVFGCVAVNQGPGRIQTYIKRGIKNVVRQCPHIDPRLNNICGIVGGCAAELLDLEEIQMTVMLAKSRIARSFSEVQRFRMAMIIQFPVTDDKIHG